jgi:putative membrane protein
MNFLWYLAYFVTDTIMLMLAGLVYVKVTPYDEIQLIRGGNVAAACALAGATIGYATVVCTVTIHGSTIPQVVIWSIISLAVQIAAFELLQYAIRDDWKAKMERDDLAHGIILGAFSLAVGILNAGCLTP